MPTPTRITDAEIIRLYTQGTPLTRIPANRDRVHRVLAHHDIPLRPKMDARRYVNDPATVAPPGQWEEQLRETARSALPPSVPVTRSASRLRQRLNQRRRQEGRLTA